MWREGRRAEARNRAPKPSPLSLTSQVADWTPKILKIVAWFDQLQEVDVDGVEPYASGEAGGEFRTRLDAVAAFDPAAALVDAPAMEGGFVRVPKIL